MKANTGTAGAGASASSSTTFMFGHWKYPWRMKFRIFRTRFYCYFVMTDGLKCFSCSVVKVSQLRQSGSPLKAHKKINLRPSFENTGAEARLPRRSAKILSGVAFRSALEGRCLYNNSTEYSVQSVWNTAER